MTTFTLSVGDQTYSVTLADTEAARALAARLPLTLSMTELNGNEKYANLDQALPTAAIQPGEIHTGDLMLYGADCLVLFSCGFHHSLLIYPPGQAGQPHRLGGSPGHRRGDGHLDCKLTGKTPPASCGMPGGVCYFASVGGAVPSPADGLEGRSKSGSRKVPTRKVRASRSR